jgi:NADH-quinone oxidoreductase subunit N
MTEFLQMSDIFESLPYMILSLGSFVLLMMALLWKKEENKGAFWFVALAITSAAFISLFKIGVDQYPMSGMLVHDRVGFSFAFTILLTLMMVLPVLPYDTSGLNEAPSSITSLLLLSACGALIMIYSNHLMVFFIGLELLSLPLYVLTGLGSRHGQSSEASFKYFLLGSISSAIFVYGAALMWATLGTLQINDMVEIFSTGLVDQTSVTLWMGMVLVTVSLLFKLGVFPFHLWIPDVYQAAPASIVAWMSSATKSATVVLAIRLLAPLPETVQLSWIMPLSLLAVGSMVWGSLGALFQTNVRRMLGYSTIAHAGYAMIAVVCVIGNSLETVSSVLAYYFLAYGVSSLIAFTIVSSEESMGMFTIKDYAGFSKRSPGKALALALALLSLAGLPPMGGFVGKFNIFYQAFQNGYGFLVILAVLTSLISLAYYLNFLVKIYMETGHNTVQKPLFGTSVVLGIASVFLIILGVYPKPIFDLFSFFAG